MKFSISIFFVVFVLAGCSREPNYLCDGFAQSEINRVMADNGASELGGVLAQAIATDGSLIHITAGIKGDSTFKKVIGGTIGDILMESSHGTENEYGKIHFDDNVSYFPYEIASVRSKTEEIFSKFDQNSHEFVLRNKQDTKDILRFSSIFPKSFHFDSISHPSLVFIDTGGIHYTWNPQSGIHKTFILLHFPFGEINPNIEATIWKVYPVSETGSFLIPSSDLALINAKIGLTSIVRVNALNVPDLRAPNHLNAVVLMSNWSQGFNLE
jgi:hypothetical protein